MQTPSLAALSWATSRAQFPAGDVCGSQLRISLSGSIFVNGQRCEIVSALGDKNGADNDPLTMFGRNLRKEERGIFGIYWPIQLLGLLISNLPRGHEMNSCRWLIVQILSTVRTDI